MSVLGVKGLMGGREEEALLLSPMAKRDPAHR